MASGAWRIASRTTTDRGTASAGRGAGASARSVNHTTLPPSDTASVPQLSLIDTTMASPRPQVASGSNSRTRGRRGSLSVTATVSQPEAKVSSTWHLLSGRACRWTLASSSVMPSRVLSRSGSSRQ